jgi:uncharacterized protein (DUF58 family)
MMMRFFRSKSERATASGALTTGGATARSELVDPQVLQQIGSLELLSRTVVDGLLAGKHRSTTKGGCCEFAQHRQYAPGDEIRQIDWQVYARNDRYFIKQFEEETNLHGIVALDTSGSMKFGQSTVSKLDYARRAAACLARLLLHQRDAVGAVILNDKRPLFVPPKQNAVHLQAILSCLQAADPVVHSTIATPGIVHLVLGLLWGSGRSESRITRGTRPWPRRGRDECAGSGRDSFQFSPLVLVPVAGSCGAAFESRPGVGSG